MIKKIIYAAIALFLLIILAFAGLLIFRAYAANNPGTEARTEVGPIYETEEFTVNLSASMNHFIKAKFAVELSNKKASAELEEKLPLLQDSIITVLSKQSLDSLLSSEGKEKLKKELSEAINAFLQKGQVTKIYFKTFIFS